MGLCFVKRECREETLLICVVGIIEICAVSE